jgi:hypothetical protein
MSRHTLALSSPRSWRCCWRRPPRWAQLRRPRWSGSATSCPHRRAHLSLQPRLRPDRRHRPTPLEPHRGQLPLLPHQPEAVRSFRARPAGQPRRRPDLADGGQEAVGRLGAQAQLARHDHLGARPGARLDTPLLGRHDGRQLQVQRPPPEHRLQRRLRRQLVAALRLQGHAGDPLRRLPRHHRRSQPGQPQLRRRLRGDQLVRPLERRAWLPPARVARLRHDVDCHRGRRAAGSIDPQIPLPHRLPAAHRARTDRSTPRSASATARAQRRRRAAVVRQSRG